MVPTIIHTLYAGVRLYSGHHNKSIPNYSVVAAKDFYDYDHNLDGINDGLWCQSASTSSSNESMWYDPKGVAVPVTDIDESDPYQNPLYVLLTFGQIGLLRDSGLKRFSGLFTCNISNEEGVKETLIVGVFTSKKYDQIGNQFLHTFLIKIIALPCCAITLKLMQVYRI